MTLTWGRQTAHHVNGSVAALDDYVPAGHLGGERCPQGSSLLPHLRNPPLGQGCHQQEGGSPCAQQGPGRQQPHEGNSGGGDGEGSIASPQGTSITHGTPSVSLAGSFTDFPFL